MASNARRRATPGICFPTHVAIAGVQSRKDGSTYAVLRFEAGKAQSDYYFRPDELRRLLEVLGAELEAIEATEAKSATSPPAVTQTLTTKSQE